MTRYMNIRILVDVMHLFTIVLYVGRVFIRLFRVNKVLSCCLASWWLLSGEKEPEWTEHKLNPYPLNKLLLKSYYNRLLPV